MFGMCCFIISSLKCIGSIWNLIKFVSDVCTCICFALDDGAGMCDMYIWLCLYMVSIYDDYIYLLMVFVCVPI